MQNLSRPIIVLFFLFLALPVQAVKPLSVVINEIAWMGNQQSFNNEWIELYNRTDSPINLDGWTLKATNGTPEINLAGTLLANSYYLLERTDDTTIPEIEADLIYVGALKNDGENLELYDNFENLIDQVYCSSDWFAGDNQTKQTMERKNTQLPGNDPENWQTSQSSGGTPRIKNSLPVQAESQEESQPKEEPIEYPSGIVINEILPDPEGIPDAEGEYIEIFNKNKEEVNISGWKIADITGLSAKTYIFPETTIIGGEKFIVLYRPETGIILNNLDGDRVKFLQPNGEIVSEVSYEKASKGRSYNRTEGGWSWSLTLTPGSSNIVPTPSTETDLVEILQEEQVEKPISQTETMGGVPQRELAAIGQQVSGSSKSLSVFLIAFALAIFSGVIILILKRKIKIDFKKDLE